MSVENSNTSGASQEAPALSPQEQQAVETGQRGFSEPTNVNTPPAQGPQRPEWLPEKFWNAEKGEANYEALAKSYGELERARSQPKEQAKEQPQEGQEAPVRGDGKITKPEPKDETQPSALQSAMETARSEWAEKQEVSEETVKALADAGIPKEIFDIYIAGVKAQQEQIINSIYSFVDGKENYEAMSRWAAENLSDAELDAFNSALDSAELRENAVRGLYARYIQARPSEGKLISPQGTSAAAGDIYTDKSQLLADQRDPRYQSDPAFRQQVMDKLARSQRSGFTLVQRPMFEREIVSKF